MKRSHDDVEEEDKEESTDHRPSTRFMDPVHLGEVQEPHVLFPCWHTIDLSTLNTLKTGDTTRVICPTCRTSCGHWGRNYALMEVMGLDVPNDASKAPSSPEEMLRYALEMEKDIQAQRQVDCDGTLIRLVAQHIQEHAGEYIKGYQSLKYRPPLVFQPRNHSCFDTAMKMAQWIDSQPITRLATIAIIEIVFRSGTLSSPYPTNYETTWNNVTMNISLRYSV